MKSKSWLNVADTPPIHVALRTYALSLSLSLGPSLVPFLTALLSGKRTSRTGFDSLKRVLRRELGIDGFAFAMALSVGGGAAIRELWRILDDASPGEGTGFRSERIAAFASHFRLTSAQKTFLANVFSSSFGILLLQAGRRRSYRLRRDLIPPSVMLPLTPPISPAPTKQTSDTLDLTLLLLVRAMDAFMQALIRKGVDTANGQQELQTPNHFAEPSQSREMLSKGKAKTETKKALQAVTSRVDAFVFWACSARIMWCFFYEPERLPRSYVKWIATLANLDGRVIQALKLLREGRWSYSKGSKSHSDVLTSLAKELGHDASWGDPAALPAYGGATANAAWKALGVRNRSGVGGLPCELVHGSVGSSLGLESSCTANTLIRGTMAFLEAVAIYLPVHFLPVLLTRPQTLLKPHRAVAILFGALRSATFLSTFVSLYWYTVCVTRSLVFARLLPFVSHDFWDGPYGCAFAGCLACGSSIWVENGHRRGEMALYVLPRAVRACLPESWIRSSSGKARIAERIAFVLSFSMLITSAIHYPETLRGLSRWTLSFILNGSNAAFWKRKRLDPIAPATPTLPPTPYPTGCNEASTTSHIPCNIPQET